MLLFRVKASRKIINLTWWNAVAIAAVFCSVNGNTKEVPSTKDDPVLGRVPGSRIVAADRKENDTLKVPLERIVFNLQSQRFNAYRTASARGQGRQILYELPAGTTLADASHYFEGRIRQANGE